MTSLRRQDAATVWTQWGMNIFESLASIPHLITAFPSIAIHTQDPLEPQPAISYTGDPGSERVGTEDTIASWVHLFRLGWIGNTFTLPQHRRRGLARAATLALARRLLSEGLLPFVLLNDSNSQSIKLHEDLGFRRQCPIHMVQVVPDQ